MKTQCAGRVHYDTWGRSRPCTRSAAEGSLYCKTHDPAMIEAKRKAKDVAWQKQHNARMRDQALKGHALELREALRTLVVESTFIAKYSAPIDKAVADARKLLKKIEADEKRYETKE